MSFLVPEEIQIFMIHAISKKKFYWTWIFNHILSLRNQLRFGKVECVRAGVLPTYFFIFVLLKFIRKKIEKYIFDYVVILKSFANLLEFIKSKCGRVLLTFLFVATPVLLAQTNDTQQQVEAPPLLIFDALKEKRFLAAYKRTFEAYWALKWVSLGDGPSSAAQKKVLGNGEVFYLYKTCRPHACDKEYLNFIYSPGSGKGWGVLSIQSDIEGLVIPNSEVENILIKALRVRYDF